MGLSRNNIALALRELAAGFGRMAEITRIEKEKKAERAEKKAERAYRNRQQDISYSKLISDQEQHAMEDRQRRADRQALIDEKIANNAYNAEKDTRQFELEGNKFKLEQDKAGKVKPEKKTIDDYYTDWLSGQTVPSKFVPIFERRYQNDIDTGGGKGKTSKGESVSVNNAYNTWVGMDSNDKAKYDNSFSVFYRDLNQSLSGTGLPSPAGAQNLTQSINPGIFPTGPMADYNNSFMADTLFNQAQQQQVQTQNQADPKEQELLTKQYKGIPLTLSEQKYLDSLYGIQ